MDQLELFCNFIKKYNLYYIVIKDYDNIEYNMDDIKNSNIYKNMRFFVKNRIEHCNIKELKFEMYLGNTISCGGGTYSIKYWFENFNEEQKKQRKYLHDDLDDMEVIVTIGDDKKFFVIDDNISSVSLTFDVSGKEEYTENIIEGLRKTLRDFGISGSWEF